MRERFSLPRQSIRSSFSLLMNGRPPAACGDAPRLLPHWHPETADGSPHGPDHRKGRADPTRSATAFPRSSSGSTQSEVGGRYPVSWRHYTHSIVRILVGWLKESVEESHGGWLCLATWSY